MKRLVGFIVIMLAAFLILTGWLPAQPGERFVSIAGTGFHPARPAFEEPTVQYYDSGMVAVGVGGSATSPVFLPSGAKITYFAARLNSSLSGEGRIKLRQIRSTSSAILMTLSTGNSATVERRPSTPIAASNRNGGVYVEVVPWDQMTPIELRYVVIGYKL